MLQMHLPLGPGDAHEQILILDRNPRREDFHGILKVRLEQDIAHTVDQGCGRRM